MNRLYSTPRSVRPGIPTHNFVDKKWFFSRCTLSTFSSRVAILPYRIDTSLFQRPIDAESLLAFFKACKMRLRTIVSTYLFAVVLQRCRMQRCCPLPFPAVRPFRFGFQDLSARSLVSRALLCRPSFGDLERILSGKSKTQSPRTSRLRSY